MMKNTYIEESFEIYQSIRSFIFWKGMSAKKRAFFEESMEHYVEFGFSIKYARSTLPNFTGIKFAERGGQQGYLHFSGLRAYIDEFTRVEALSFHKLVYLFRIYCAESSRWTDDEENQIQRLALFHFDRWRFACGDSGNTADGMEQTI